MPERPDLTESFSAWNRNRSRPELALWQKGCPLHGALREASSLLWVVVRDLFTAHGRRGAGYKTAKHAELRSPL